MLLIFRKIKNPAPKPVKNLKNPGCGGKNEGVENLTESCPTAYRYLPLTPDTKRHNANKSPPTKICPRWRPPPTCPLRAPPPGHRRPEAEGSGCCRHCRSRGRLQGFRARLVPHQLRSCRPRGGGSTRPISAGLVGRGSSPMGGRVVELRGRQRLEER